MPALSSEQARANRNQPRMSELELQRLLHAIAANDKTNAELAKEFGKAASTVYNIKVKYRDQIEDIRRKWTVQFEDLWMTRKQARLDDIQELRDLAWEQLRALLASNVVIDGRTGELMAGPVDERKFKVYAELILKANRNFAEETGQLPQRVEGLDQRYTAPVLGLGSGSIDYTAIAERRREREATAPQREAEQRERRQASRERIDTMIRQLEAVVRPDPEPEEDTEPVRHDDEPEEQTEEPEQNVDQVIRLRPPRESVEEPEPEPEGEPEPDPEPDRFESPLQVEFHEDRYHLIMFATRGRNGFTAQELEEIAHRQAAKPRHIKPRKPPQATNRSDLELLRQQLLKAFGS